MDEKTSKIPVGKTGRTTEHMLGLSALKKILRRLREVFDAHCAANRAALAGKVDKVSGKGLSSCDFTEEMRAWVEQKMNE